MGIHFRDCLVYRFCGVENDSQRLFKFYLTKMYKCVIVKKGKGLYGIPIHSPLLTVREGDDPS